MDSGERDVVMSAPREVPIRESAPPAASRPYPRPHEPAWSNAPPDEPRHSAADVWAGAISRLQTQVSLNTSMLESHRRQFQEVNLRIDDLKQEVGNVAATLHDIRSELRARGGAPLSGRPDAGDLDLLIGQVEAVTAKANEIDGMKLQLDLTKNRLKRLEELGPSAAPQPRPGTSASLSQKEAPLHEASLPPSHNSPYPPAPHAPHHAPLPPMRTASMASPVHGYSAGPHHPSSTLESLRPGYPQPLEPRQYSAEPSAIHGSPAGGFRPAEPLPPPSSLPGWRSSESLSHGLAAPLPASTQSRSSTREPEPHASGWAAVNAAQPVKRPYEEPRASPFESPGTGSPKRPKLAPIMPRGSHPEDIYAQTAPGPLGSTGPNRSRAASDASQSLSHVASSTTASTSAPSYRFITSTSQADPHESWRRDHEGRRHHGHGPGQGVGHGRRGGRRGGRGGRRARGGGVIIQEGREPSSPEWEQSQWAEGQAPQNGYHHPPGHPYSPMMGRGGRGGRGGGFGGGRADRDGEAPETPIQVGEEAAMFDGGDGSPHGFGGGKKTRTKPIRNADGILIRKDGRPDMRSVSSANNLRKVHAKKEAERADFDGKPLTSTRLLAPMQPYSPDGEARSPSGTPGTPREQDSTEHEIPHDKDEDQHSTVNGVAERYLPPSDSQETSEVGTKTAAEVGDTRDQNEHAPADVEMREPNVAQATARQQEKDTDTQMNTAEEANEAQDGASSHEQSGQ